MKLASIEITRFLKRNNNTMKLTRIMGLVKLCDMKLTWVKGNCE